MPPSGQSGGRGRPDLCELEASLVCSEFQTARAVLRDLSQKKKIKKSAMELVI